MKTGNVPDRSNNISVSIGLQNVMDHYGTDQKAIRYNGNKVVVTATAQKIIFSIKDFFSKCDQIRRKLKKVLMENLIFLCSVHLNKAFFISI